MNRPRLPITRPPLPPLKFRPSMVRHGEGEHRKAKEHPPEGKGLRRTLTVIFRAS